ncbi:MAG: RNA polymerase sigma factor [Planctomycetota bacterium]|jgi:RNA polymerase sigma-70 factor (ECF subfamily)
MTKRQLEQLLCHESFLKALALKLLRDRARADDVVQETWLVALRSAKSPSEVRRGWLAGIVRNLVRRARRDDERRARREFVAAREGHTKATDELCTDESVRRRMAQLVLALPDHYRDVILLRFYDGLTPLLIARRLGVSDSTVRTRLQRGLQRLRARLEGENGDGEQLSLSLALIALAPARKAGAALKLQAAGLLLALGAVVTLWHQQSSAAGRRTGMDLVRSSMAAARGAAAGATLSNRRDGATPRGAPAPVVTGVVRLPNGVANRKVSLTVQHTKMVVTADTGFSVPVRAAPGVMVRAVHPETQPAVVAVRAERDPRTGKKVFRPIEIVLVRRPLVPEEMLASARIDDDAAAAGGTALLAAGLAAGRRATGKAAPVHLSGLIGLPEGVVPETVQLHVGAPEGDALRFRVLPHTHFRLRVESLLTDPLPRALRVRAWHPGTLPREVTVPVLVDTATEVPQLEFLALALERGRTLAGTVTLDEAGPADGATIAVYASNDLQQLAATTTDDEGGFTVAIDPEREAFVVAVVEGFRPAGLPADADLEFLLTRGAEITGRAAPGLEVSARRVVPAGAAPLVLQPGLSLLREAQDIAWWEVDGRTDALGAYALAGLAEADYDVALVGTDQEQRVRAPGTADFVTPPSTLLVEVRGDGAPLAAQVRIGEQDLETDAEGRLRIEVAPVLHMVTVSADGYVEETQGALAPGQVSFDLEPIATQATLEVTLQGPVAPAVCDFRLTRLDWFEAPRVVSAPREDGRYVLRDLEPGGFLLAVASGEDYLPTDAFVILSAGVTTPATLTLVRGGRVVVDVRTPMGFHVGAVDIWIDTYTPRPLPKPGELWRSDLLAPGLHTLHVEPWDFRFAPRTIPIEVRPGATDKIDVYVTRVFHDPR